MAGRGYVKLHREAMDHAVFQDEWLWKVFCWCVMKANFRAVAGPRQTVLRGAFTTGRNRAAEELNAAPSRVYRAFERLQVLGCIKVEPNSNWTTITVCNYETYNSDQDTDRTTDEQPVNNKRTTNEQPTDTYKETKNPINQEAKKPRSSTTPKPPPEAFADFLDCWNKTDGATPIRKLTDKRQTALSARLAEADWDWKAALAKFPLRCFASEQNGYVPDIEFFLRPDTVTKILEGKYDWSKTPNGKPATAPPGPGQVHKAGHEIDW